MVLNLQTQDSRTVSRFRSVSSQFIACMSSNLLLFDLGMAIGFVTIAMPNLLNTSNSLSLDEVQASWFGSQTECYIDFFFLFSLASYGSISFLTQPFGALMSGPIVDYFGRKKANFLVNIPHLIAWILMYLAWNLPSLFIANGLLGFGTGIMEAPINSYVGEVSEPSIRGALCTVSQLFVAIGVFVMYFLGTVVNWREAALIALAVPIISMLLILLVPETPVWLLVRGRQNDALKSLRFLRGWTTTENVKEEFDQLAVYSQTLQQCVICYKTNGGKTETCIHRDMNVITRLILKFRYVMLSKETLRPLVLVLLYFTFIVMSGLAPIRPNMVNVCGALGMPGNLNNVVLMVGIITFCTSVMVVGLIKILGKRKLAISSLLGIALSCTALSAYAKANIPDTVFSYNTDTFPKETSYVPLVFFYLMTIFTGFAIPWVLLGEVFPFRSRASAQGFAAAGNYVITFLASKSFIDLEIGLKLWGTFAVYAAFGFAGTLYLYFFLPETEGKTLQEIESYYNGKLRTFANDKFVNFFKSFKRKHEKDKDKAQEE